MTARGDAPRLLIGGGLVAALVIAALSWFVVVSPLRSGTQTLRDDTAAVETQNVAIETQNVSLRQQLEDRDQLVESARQALAELPPGAQLPGFNRQLARQARARGVDLTSITVGASTSAAVAGAAADPTAPSTGTLTIPVTIQTTGTMAQQLLFLNELQQVGPRRALLTSTSLAPGQVGSSIETSSTMTVQLTVFAAPLADAVRTQLAGVIRPGRSS
jgi:Tfp pilus assembly protein PilO